MTTRDDLFRIRTEPSDTAQRVSKAVRRIFQFRGTKRRSKQAMTKLDPRIRRDVGLEHDIS